MPVFASCNRYPVFAALLPEWVMSSNAQLVHVVDEDCMLSPCPVVRTFVDRFNPVPVDMVLPLISITVPDVWTVSLMSIATDDVCVLR